MSTTKIQIEAEVFDDAEYCDDIDNECEHLASYSSCYVFGVSLKPVKKNNENFRLKCDQCKEAYQKTIACKK